MQQFFQFRGADGFFSNPWDDGDAIREFVQDFMNEWLFVAGARFEQRIGRAGFGEALVHNPCERFDVSASKIFLKRGGFVNRCGFRQRDDEDARE